MAARSQKSRTTAVSAARSADGSNCMNTLRPVRKKFEIDHRNTVLTWLPGCRPARPISSAGMAASMTRIIAA